MDPGPEDGVALLHRPPATGHRASVSTSVIRIAAPSWRTVSSGPVGGVDLALVQLGELGIGEGEDLWSPLDDQDDRGVRAPDRLQGVLDDGVDGDVDLFEFVQFSGQLAERSR